MSWVKHNIQKTNGIFASDYKCINCGKSLDQLYIELVDATDMWIWNQWVKTTFIDYDLRISLVENHHEGCLSEDELMIKDLIE
jgi:hypothetical protein